MWVFTASSLTTSLLATALLECPETSNSSTSDSRWVRPRCAPAQNSSRLRRAAESATRPARPLVDDGLTLADPAQVADEFPPVDALEDVAGGAHPQRLVKVVLVVVHGKQDDFGVGILRVDLSAEVQAAVLADTHIAQHDIGTLLGNHP